MIKIAKISNTLIMFHIWAAMALASASCAVPMEEDDFDDPAELGEASSEISSSCGNLGQNACYSIVSGYYCNYNLFKYRDNPIQNIRCECTNGFIFNAWAGESLACVPSTCLADATVIKSVKALWADKGLGSITKEALGELPRAPDIGQFYNQETYVYRATSYSKEIAYMQDNMKTMAKAYFRTPSWDKIGPKITDSNRSLLSLPFQLMAIASSDTPKSQFSSAALTFDIAKSFAAKDAYVYALKVNPRSHIFGMQNCDVGVFTGELQFQVPHDTVIKSLRRKKASGGSWEYWSKSAKAWKKSKCNQNSPTWQCTAKDVKDEL